MAALIFGLEHFEMYLVGKPCTIYTDHQADDCILSALDELNERTFGLLVFANFQVLTTYEADIQV